MKFRFGVIFVISSILTIATPALAQTSVEPNQLVQGLNLVRATVEWVVLLGLIVSAVTSSLLIVNRRSSRIKVLLTGMRASVVLGVLAGCTAFILENWTSLLIFDVLSAVAQAIFFLFAALTFPKRN